MQMPLRTARIDFKKFVRLGLDHKVQTLKVQYAPQFAHVILVRVENIGDKFDSDTKAYVPSPEEVAYRISMHDLAKELYSYVNGGKKVPY